MTKVALITDTHFGARSDSHAYDKFFEKFYTDIFFPELKKRKIKTVVHLGDVFDRRKFINFSTLKSCKKYFFDVLEKNNISCHVIAGNHDTFYKNTNEVNSLDILLQGYSKLTTYSNPTYAMIGGVNVLLLPWICADNYQESLRVIKEEASDICFGHLELSGFEMHRGHMCDQGVVNNDIFKNYSHVFSGHFHHRSTKGNITYLGNPYEFTWSDYGDIRGFHVFDMKSKELEFIENPYTIFEKLYYNDAKLDYSSFDFKELANKNIKVIVEEKNDAYKFEKFIQSLYNIPYLDLKIVEDFLDTDSKIDDENVNIEDTMSLLSTYVDGLETTMKKDKLKSILKTLYVEAQNFKDK
jgi:DNA repair exonuclease SbcCD nuclease subunit